MLSIPVLMITTFFIILLSLISVSFCVMKNMTIKIINLIIMKHIIPIINSQSFFIYTMRNGGGYCCTYFRKLVV